MKTFLHITKNTDKSSIKNLLLLKIELYNHSTFEMEDIELDYPDLNYNNNNYQFENIIDKKANPYLVFKDIFMVGFLIEKSLRVEHDLKPLSNYLNANKYDFYKMTVKNVLKKGNNLQLFTLIIINLLEKYGIIITSKPDDEFNTCNMLDLITYCYLIYESYNLFYCLQNYTKIDLKLFNFYAKNKSREESFNYIDDTVHFLNHIFPKNYYNKYEYNNENERWDNILIFENALQLSIYYLKEYLSSDANDDNIGICKYCKSPFERTGHKKKTCDNYECICARQNNRKRKSNEKKRNKIHKKV